MPENSEKGRGEALDPLRQALAAEPTNVDVANRYWKALGKRGGQDLRSGRTVIEVYRLAALGSQKGAVALGRAYKELFDASGEPPRVAYFDEDLIHALEKWYPTTRGDERPLIKWLLERIKQHG